MGRFVQFVVDEARKFVVGAVPGQKLVDQLVVFVPKSDLEVMAVGSARFVNFDKLKSDGSVLRMRLIRAFHRPARCGR